MRVLVVDDSSVARRVAETALSARRVQIVAAASRDEALTIVAGHTFDAAVLDLELDDGTGIEIADALRAGSPDCRMVFVTGSSDPALVAQAKARGPVFAKPEGYAAAVASLFAAPSAPSRLPLPVEEAKRARETSPP